MLSKRLHDTDLCTFYHPSCLQVASCLRPTLGQVPRADPAMERHDLLDFGAGYIQRSIDELPKRGEAWPWCPRMYYVSDLLSIRHGALVDSAMEFRRPHAKPD